jgi:hypothetical protein
MHGASTFRNVLDLKGGQKSGKENRNCDPIAQNRSGTVTTAAFSPSCKLVESQQVEAYSVGSAASSQEISFAFSAISACLLNL